MAVWKMKCAGYEVDFQRELVEGSPDWVPQPPNAAKNQGAPWMGSNRRREELQGSEILRTTILPSKELIYRPKGTKTRPIVV